MIADLPTFWLGIGCQRGTSSFLIHYAIVSVCQRYSLTLEGISGLATIDFKGTNPALLQICSKLRLPLITFTPEELASVKVLSPSLMVKTAVGTPSVAEAAALLAASTNKLLVPKQIIKLSPQPGAVTVAIAESEG